jgi:hypothetical protein
MPTSAPFELSIIFGGLCLVATDDTRPTSPRLHVLLMKHGLGTKHEHVPYVIYDDAYGNPSPQQESGNITCHKVDNGAIDVSLGTTPLDLSTMPSTVGALSDFTDLGPIDPAYVTGNCKHVARTRMTFFEGVAGQCGHGANFTAVTSSGNTWAGVRTNWFEWRIDGIVSDDGQSTRGLLFKFQSLERGAAPTPFPLYPQQDSGNPAKDKIRIYVLNVTLPELPGGSYRVRPPQAAEDFAAYYKVYRHSTKKERVIPVLADGNFAHDSPLSYVKGGCPGTRIPSATTKGSTHGPSGRQGIEITDNSCLTAPQCIHALVAVKA